MDLKEYFKKYNTDIYTSKINNINIFIQKYNGDELCIELTKKDNSININNLVNITLDTKIKNIDNIVIGSIIDYYFNNNI